MSGELDEFVDSEGGAGGDSPDDGSRAVLQDAFLFKYGPLTYAVNASRVAGVVPWRPPVPLPRADPRVRGVIQDRGRIVVLLTHPTGELYVEDDVKVARVIICTTERGYVGLPASATLRVGQVRFAHEPQPGATVDSDVGALTYLDPSEYVMR